MTRRFPNWTSSAFPCTRIFNLPRAEQTARVVRAISNPNVDIFFHPTGRLINKRRRTTSISTIIAAAKKTGTILEIDAFPIAAILKTNISANASKRA